MKLDFDKPMRGKNSKKPVRFLGTTKHDYVFEHDPDHTSSVQAYPQQVVEEWVENYWPEPRILYVNEWKSLEDSKPNWFGVPRLVPGFAPNNDKFIRTIKLIEVIE